MKKFLTMVVALISLLSMSSCSLIVEKKEAEYKAKIKQELDSIPLEETGYKLVETTIDDSEQIPCKKELLINGQKYKFDEYNENDYLCVTVDTQIDSSSIISFSKYGDVFKNYSMFYGCYYFDNKIFLIKYNRGSPWDWPQYENCLPHIFFLYNYEENTIKYCGYFEEWFNYRPSTGKSKRFKIIKL